MTDKNDDIKADDDVEFGIELDKLELPQTDPDRVLEKPLSAKPGAEPGGQPRVEAKPAPKAAPKVAPKKKSSLTMIAIGAAALVVALLFFYGQDILTFSFLSKKKQLTAGSAGGYHAIDPIITNLGEYRQIKIFLLIRNPSHQEEQVSAMESAARDRILTYLASPPTRKMARESDSDALKSNIEIKIMHLLKSDYNDRVILKELKVL